MNWNKMFLSFLAVSVSLFETLQTVSADEVQGPKTRAELMATSTGKNDNPCKGIDAKEKLCSITVGGSISNSRGFGNLGTGGGAEIRLNYQSGRSDNNDTQLKANFGMVNDRKGNLYGGAEILSAGWLKKNGNSAALYANISSVPNMSVGDIGAGVKLDRENGSTTVLLIPAGTFADGARNTQNAYSPAVRVMSQQQISDVLEIHAFLSGRAVMGLKTNFQPLANGDVIHNDFQPGGRPGWSI